MLYIIFQFFMLWVSLSSEPAVATSTNIDSALAQTTYVAEENTTVTKKNDVVKNTNHVSSHDVINTVTLFDSEKQIIDKLGEPIEVVDEEHFPGRSKYRYKNMDIGISHDMVDYIAIPSEVGVFTINNEEIKTNIEELEKYFGTPDLITEDGIVYKKNETYVKALYSQNDKSHIDSVHFFLEH